jgi:hypothetical protein
VLARSTRRMINRAATACGLRPRVDEQPQLSWNTCRRLRTKLGAQEPLSCSAALELRPIGFLLKHSTGQELLKAIERVLHGHVLSNARAES